MRKFIIPITLLIFAGACLLLAIGFYLVLGDLEKALLPGGAAGLQILLAVDLLRRRDVELRAQIRLDVLCDLAQDGLNFQIDKATGKGGPA